MKYPVRPFVFAITASFAFAARLPVLAAETQPAAPQPWRGIHLMLGSDVAAKQLIAQLPALQALGVNSLIVEVNYNFAFESHPALRGGSWCITRTTARELTAACRKYSIRLIPQFSCLGHQSWAENTQPLLIKHPELDETPGQYPKNKGIYCRSWCPQHPEVNPIVFALIDELIDAFEADAFHVGMDEVFLIASEHCSRCKGHDPAKLFAKAVNDLHGHLVGKRGVEMLMWGDRFLDAKSTGYGEWEASANGTAPAIDLIPKDIILCDWHYGKRDDYPSIPLFLKKGFRVWPSGWNDVAATNALLDAEQKHADPRLLGHLCTVWGAVPIDKLATWPPIIAAMKHPAVAVPPGAK